MNEEQMSPWLGTHALNSQVLNINDDLRVRRATRLQVERAPWGGTRGDLKQLKLKEKKNLLQYTTDSASMQFTSMFQQRRNSLPQHHTKHKTHGKKANCTR